MHCEEADFCFRGPCDFHYFRAAPLASYDAHGRARQAQAAGEKFHHRLIRFPVFRWRGDFEFVIPRSAGESGAAGARMNLQYDFQITKSPNHQINPGLLFPKIAVPTRTIVAPSSMAASKSLVMPMESSAVPRRSPISRRRRK